MEILQPKKFAYYKINRRLKPQLYKQSPPARTEEIQPAPVA